MRRARRALAARLKCVLLQNQMTSANPTCAGGLIRAKEMAGDTDAEKYSTDRISAGSVWRMPGMGILAHAPAANHENKLWPHLVLRPCPGGYLCLPRTTKRPRKPGYKVYFTKKFVCSGLDEPGWFLFDCAYPFSLKFFPTEARYRVCSLPAETFAQLLKAYEEFIDRQRPRV